MNTKLDYSAIDRLAITEAAKREPVQANPNSRACLLVLQGLKPFRERPPAFGALVVANFNHWKQCNLYITALSRSALKCLDLAEMAEVPTSAQISRTPTLRRCRRWRYCTKNGSSGQVSSRRSVVQRERPLGTSGYFRNRPIAVTGKQCMKRQRVSVLPLIADLRGQRLFTTS